MKKVLIVDDSVSMRQMVGFTLREGGFDVIEAEHGQDALDKLKSATVDLVITDLNMPVMDGITLIQNLRQQPAMKTKPILMLTTEGLSAKKEAGQGGRGHRLDRQTVRSGKAAADGGQGVALRRIQQWCQRCSRTLRSRSAH